MVKFGLPVSKIQGMLPDKKQKDNSMRCSFIALVLSFYPMTLTAAELSIAGRGEFYLSQTPDSEPYARPWWQKGTGQLAQQKQFSAGPQYLVSRLDTDSAWSAQLHAQWHRAPEAGFGITEGWLQYSPLPWSGYRFRSRIGYFYPSLSLENTDIAWTSPYSSNFSAANSWIAEEIKARGVEISLSRPGRFFHTEHSHQAVVGLFQGNDPAGSLLAWRGFAIHPYQTALGERVDFARYLSIGPGSAIPNQPSWVEPNRELDRRTGYYLGWHWLYQQTELRLYHYDNKADPLVLTNQYGWRSKFTNLALQHQWTEQLRLVAQWLRGDTQMGADVVKADYQAWFLLVNYQANDWQGTVRYDHFWVKDRDQTPADDNNGDGDSWTLRLAYPLTEQLSSALEYSIVSSSQANRAQWAGWPVEFSQRSLRFTLTYQFAL
ncbi:hypothetical protein [Rheinheimera sp.]|uniref:hypothetical protein n=1 Tax=Rheinheimera sp. TaxID=1869214 RepID=UPI003AF99714